VEEFMFFLIWPLAILPFVFFWPFFPIILILWPFIFLLCLGCMAAEEHERGQYIYTYPVTTGKVVS
jgi:hypothetical protein